MTEQPTKETEVCIHESVHERDPDHIQTGCGSFYFWDEHNNAFIYCPYCGKEIEEFEGLFDE